MKRLLFIILILTMITTFFSGCSKKGEPSYKEEDMPYGSTIFDNKTDYKVRISYDRRFLEDGQLRALTDFYYAVEKKDLSLLNSVLFPEYFEGYSMEFHGLTVSDFLDRLYSTTAAAIGDNFHFVICEITDINNERIASGIDTILEQLDIVSMKENNEKVSEKISNVYAVTVDCTLESGENQSIINGDLLFLFEYENKYYVVI